MKIIDLKKDMLRLANPKQAANLQRFFKTGPGEYGYGDIFLGIKVPEQRKIAKRYKELSLDEIEELLKSKIHEHRLTSLFILVDKYKKSENKKEIFEFYLRNTKNINNWDLVDSSAPYIIGDYLLDKDKSILYELVKSKNIWERRIAVLGSGGFIKSSKIFHRFQTSGQDTKVGFTSGKFLGLRENRLKPKGRASHLSRTGCSQFSLENKKFDDILKISEILIKDEHDLIHKAVGWMLREVGKRNQKVEEDFLKRHYKTMPRTMLRYAIEKFDEKKRRFYLG